MAHENLAEEQPRDHERANFKLHVYLKSNQKLKQSAIESIVRDCVDESQVFPIFRDDDVTFSKIVDQWMELTKIIKIDLDLKVGGRNVPFEKFTPKYKVTKWARETLAVQPEVNEDSEEFLTFLNANKQKYGARVIREAFLAVKNEHDLNRAAVPNVVAPAIEAMPANDALQEEPVAQLELNFLDLLEPIAAEGLEAGMPVVQGAETAQEIDFGDVFDNLDQNALFGDILNAPIEAGFFDNLDLNILDQQISFGNLEF